MANYKYNTTDPSKSDYVPPNAVWNRYGEVIGTNPNGGTTIPGSAGTDIHGGYTGGFQGVQSNSSNIGGQSVNLLTGIKAPAAGGGLTYSQADVDKAKADAKAAADTQWASQFSNLFNPQTAIDQAKAQTTALKATSLADLRAAYDQSRSSLQSQTPGINQNAVNNLNANDSYYYAQALPQLRAAMEATGNYGGGEMLGQNVNLLTTRGQNANDINMQKGSQLQAIADAVAQLNAEQPLKEASLSSSLDAQGIAAAMTAAQQGISNQLSLANLTGISPTGGQTLAGKEFDATQAYQAWNQQFQEGQAATQSSQFNAQMAYQASRDQILDGQWLEQFDQGQQKMILDNALAQKRISQDDYANATSRMNANTSATNAQASNNPYANYDNSSDYQSDYNGIMQNAKGSVTEVMANSQALIQKYGVDGYNKLLAAARSVDPDYVSY